ncbi:MAG: hypothetical protein HYR77_11495 [Ignavibacteria bacterium]|nr:hypothetical protein [Ignavibacteria bacterium]
MKHQGFSNTAIVLSLLVTLLAVVIISSLALQKRSQRVTSTSHPSSPSVGTDSIVLAPNHSRGGVSFDQLKQKLRLNFYYPAPAGFDPAVPLQQVQPLIYPFPGYQYQRLTVRMRDSPRDAYTELKLPAVTAAKQRGEFILGLFIEGYVTPSPTPVKDLFVDYYDAYYFLFSYSPKEGRYQLFNKALSLQGVPPELRTRAVSIASKLTHGDVISTVGWIRKDITGTIPGAEGLQEGTIYIQTQPSELSMAPYAAYYFVDVSNGSVVKVKKFE